MIVIDANGNIKFVGATHNILSPTHADSLTGSVVQGDVLVGNATPKWDRLPANATATKKFLRSVSGGVPSFEQVAYIELSGAPVYPVTATSISYVVLATDVFIIADASGGNITVTLPNPATVSGQVFTTKKIDNTGFTVTVVSNAGELIDGEASQVISAQYVALSVISNGVLWYII